MLTLPVYFFEVCFLQSWPEPTSFCFDRPRLVEKKPPECSTDSSSHFCPKYSICPRQGTGQLPQLNGSDYVMHHVFVTFHHCVVVVNITLMVSPPEPRLW